MLLEDAVVSMLSKARRSGSVDELFKRRTVRALIQRGRLAQWLVGGPKLILTKAE